MLAAFLQTLDETSFNSSRRIFWQFALQSLTLAAVAMLAKPIPIKIERT
jgi:hypothetical protein